MKHVLKSAIILGVMVGLFSGLNLYANGLNLNGNGCKAISMGGAFIGLADDYSAVFWNPAGLTQLKRPQLALFGADIIPTATYQLDTPYFSIDTQTENRQFPNIGLGFFKPLSKKMTAGIYVYVPAGIGATWDGDQLAYLSGGSSMEWETFSAIVSISPAFAYQVTDQLSVGATVNINYGMLKIKRPIVNAVPPMLGQYEEDINGWSVSATLGVLFKPVEKLSIGLSFKTPFSVTLSGESKATGGGALALLAGDEPAERKFTWPMWFGAGIAFKATDRLTITADAQFTNWKKMDAVGINFESPLWKAYMEDGARFDLRWKNTVQLRFGMEYKLSDKFALRGGYYYDPDPSPKETMNILLPEISFNFFTFGFGYDSDKLTIEACLEVAIGKEETVGFDEVDPEAGMPGRHDMNIWIPTIGVTYRF